MVQIPPASLLGLHLVCGGLVRQKSSPVSGFKAKRPHNSSGGGRGIACFAIVGRGGEGTYSKGCLHDAKEPLEGSVPRHVLDGNLYLRSKD